MKHIIKKITITTKDPIEIIDITDRVRSLLLEAGIKEGSVTVITQHTTTAININEREKELQQDMVSFLKEFVPAGAGYAHDRNAIDGRGNAHSHLTALFANASETIPVTNGEMMLGTWQSIFFIELDGPRDVRKVVVHING